MVKLAEAGQALYTQAQAALERAARAPKKVLKAPEPEPEPEPQAVSKSQLRVNAPVFFTPGAGTGYSPQAAAAVAAPVLPPAGFTTLAADPRYGYAPPMAAPHPQFIVPGNVPPAGAAGLGGMSLGDGGGGDIASIVAGLVGKLDQSNVAKGALNKSQ